jgi:hypothetical protein
LRIFASYSSYLSERDHSDFDQVFKLFGVSQMVKYGTFQQLSERLLNAEGDVRALTEVVMLAANAAPRVIQGGAKTGVITQQPRKRILLVDEVFYSFKLSRLCLRRRLCSSPISAIFFLISSILALTFCVALPFHSPNLPESPSTSLLPSSSPS